MMQCNGYNGFFCFDDNDYAQIVISDEYDNTISFFSFNIENIEEQGQWLEQNVGFSTISTKINVNF